MTSIRATRPPRSLDSARDDGFVGYRAFVLVVAVAYMTVIAVTPRPSWQPQPVPVALLTFLGLIYLALGIWGFELAQRQGKLILSLAYLGIEFALGMYISNLAPGGLLPMILLPIAAQAVSILPRWWAVAICALVVAGISGNLTWVPAWPYWFRNIAIAAAAVLFVVVYVGAAKRERQARMRAEKLADEVAQLAAANERNRIARDIHDTLGHYLTIIHVQLEAARAVIGTDAERGLFAVNRAQTLAKDGLAAVRQSVRALREDADVEGIADQIAALVDTVRDETFTATFTCRGTPRPVSAATALALHRTTLEALTNVRRHADARAVRIELAFRDDARVSLRVQDDGKGAAACHPERESRDLGGGRRAAQPGSPGSLDSERDDRRETTGFGLKGIRERAEQLGGTVTHRTAPGEGFLLEVELPA